MAFDLAGWVRGFPTREVVAEEYDAAHGLVRARGRWVEHVTRVYATLKGQGRTPQQIATTLASGDQVKPHEFAALERGTLVYLEHSTPALDREISDRQAHYWLRFAQELASEVLGIYGMRGACLAEWTGWLRRLSEHEAGTGSAEALAEAHRRTTEFADIWPWLRAAYAAGQRRQGYPHD